MATPTPATAPARSGADRCPGLLSPFVSADGAMVRLRVPGGWLPTATLRAVSDLAGAHGDPDLTLTSRGSLQLRGLPEVLPAEVITTVGDLGLVPSAAHDRARNIVADPGDPQVRAMVAALDAALLADDVAAGLPGRFLLAVAGPDGPVLAEPWDLAVVVDAAAPAQATVLVDGRSLTVPADQASQVVLAVIHRFLAERPGARTWNVADLDADARAGLLPGAVPASPRPAAPPLPGPLPGATTAPTRGLLAMAPLGLLTPAQVAALAEVAEEVQLTPWRAVLVPVAGSDTGTGTDGATSGVPDRLSAAGLVLDPSSPWTVLSACAGAPGCARTEVPTRDIARAAAPRIDPAGPPVHVIGCERACGHPAREHLRVDSPAGADAVVAVQRAMMTRSRTADQEDR